MGKDSKIEWTHHTFNPWWGCVKVSDGCKHCYAETFSKRTGNNVWGVDAERRMFGDKHWNEPLKWDREAQAAGERRRVFCASMADVFEDNAQVIEARKRLWELIIKTPNLDWLLLTKRPENIMDMIPWDLLTWGLPTNVWLGTTCENQEQADKRIPHLLRVPAAVRFLSCEPLLGPVDLERPMPGPDLYQGDGKSICQPWYIQSGIHWVIAGGESGSGSRPMHPVWADSLLEQCNDAGVPFLFKQWGDWFPRSQWEHSPHLVLPDDSDCSQSNVTHVFDDGEIMHRVGKKAAYRQLNGALHDGYPDTLIKA